VAEKRRQGCDICTPCKSARALSETTWRANERTPRPQVRRIPPLMNRRSELQHVRQVVGLEPQADVEFTEQTVHGAARIEAHFVDDVADALEIAREQRHAHSQSSRPVQLVISCSTRPANFRPVAPCPPISALRSSNGSVYQLRVSPRALLIG